jgi:hypothetical protein
MAAVQKHPQHEQQQNIQGLNADYNNKSYVKVHYTLEV